jgi:hypothetical protein
VPISSISQNSREWRAPPKTLDFWACADFEIFLSFSS